MKRLFATIIALNSVTVVADPASYKEISCGDHWFSVEVALAGDQSTVTISGDSVIGEDLVYSTAAVLSQDGDMTVFGFSFGETDAPAQSLAVKFQADHDFGTGVYQSSPDAFAINMHCLRR